MQINNNYIPVRGLPNRPLTHEEKEIVKEIIKVEKEAQEIRKEMLSYKPLLEKGLAWIKAQKAERSSVSDSNIASKSTAAKTAYDTANKISSNIKRLDSLELSAPKPINQTSTLAQADFSLSIGSYRGALKGYSSILQDRANSKLPESYRPKEEQLRQASRLYRDLQLFIEKLDISSGLKKKLYCTGISAHTQGIFALSKAEVLHMINNQFFYPN